MLVGDDVRREERRVDWQKHDWYVAWFDAQLEEAPVRAVQV